MTADQRPDAWDRLTANIRSLPTHDAVTAAARLARWTPIPKDAS